MDKEQYSKSYTLLKVLWDSAAKKARKLYVITQNDGSERTYPLIVYTRKW